MMHAEIVSPLHALDCLIVEDEPLIAMTLQEMILDLGASTAILATRLKKGMELARSAHLDIAFLDINLGDAMSYPVADILRDRGVPFMFVTSYGPEFVEHHKGAPILHKPYDEAMVARASAALLGGASVPPR